MADNYLEKQYESYLARKASMGKKSPKKKPVAKSQRLLPEALEALKEIIDQPSIRIPFDLFREQLYSADSLYKGYQLGKPLSFKECYDQQVYHHYLKAGKSATDIKESLARTLHDHSMTNAMNDFLAHFDEKQVVGIMGGHGLLRNEDAYRQVVMVSKTLAENDCLMVSGGGPGAMEATHLGAWMAGRTEEEMDDALTLLKEAPSYKDSRWLDTALQVMKKYPQEKYVSLGVPTWLYGHEPATPFATHIAKYFDNSIREDSILTIAKGGIIYSPGSAGTMQEIFQEAVQNHYLSFGYASPMIFMNKQYWTEEMPVYRLMQHLVDKGKYKNLLMTLTDSSDEIVKVLLDFRNKA
ncbi:MAG: LOG family protein [Bacteroidaceae bacterium]|nr:LOG family protein [Bacteroidaceae bacterium]